MKKSKILTLLDRHEKKRAEGINLVVSENHLSQGVRKALASDLAGRYHTPWYGGTFTAREIVETAEALARKLFKAEHALVLSLSGNICDLAALFAFTTPGDSVAMLPFQNGGYPFGLEKFGRKRVDLPVEPGTFDIDAKQAAGRIESVQAPLTFLGSSCILFPHPVAQISKAIHETVPGGVCVYDGSHVLGLIATGAFQDPLREGADVLIGSTHKTFPGPQGGLIVTNSSEHFGALNRMLDFDIESGIGLVDNPHVNRIAALGVALEEMLDDLDYGKRVVENARALAGALDENNVPVRFKDRGYTASHQVLLDLESDRAEKLCHDLESVGIFIDIGGRIGAAEVTRRGMGFEAVQTIAKIMAKVHHHGPTEELQARVRHLALNGPNRAQR